MKKKKVEEKQNIQRIDADFTVGLTSADVEERTSKGYTNATPKDASKSYLSIIRTNLITLFNGINLILGLLVIFFGDIQNALFLGTVTVNILIGIIQEIRSKKTVEKLSLLTEPKVKVVRDSIEQEIDIQQLVVDDIMVLKAGNQIPSDSIVVDGELSVNESLLTGEQDAVKKQVGDTLFSGSFVVSGTSRAKVDKVGADNYSSKIVSSAKKYKKPNSELMKGIQWIIRAVTIMLFIVGPLVFWNNAKNYDSLNKVVNYSVGAIIGMIPEGLVLLTSVALAVGVIRLSKKNTLVQELYCIETLARVDMLCLDKTGTITEGTMQVEDVIKLKRTRDNIENIIGNMVDALDDNNATFMALKDRFQSTDKMNFTDKMPFNSTRKMSAVRFDDGNTYIIGAPEFVLKDRISEVEDIVNENAKKGYRVLVLAKTVEEISEKDFNTKKIKPVAVIVISDKIRENAADTLSYFAKQGVNIKIISGDNPVTVSKIAERVGLKGAEKYVDASTLKTDEQIFDAVKKYVVFGRVTPLQKKQIVKALKLQGHTVGMTGDGVNDVMALKESDCSIAMASGSDAARNTSQLVLLDNNFASLPYVVAEGRRVVNNIIRAASLFIVKTSLSILLAICMVIMDIGTPFVAIQLTLISTVIVGIPSFFLAIEPNDSKISGTFLSKVAKTALPAGITITIMIVLAHILAPELLDVDGQMSTFCFYIYALMQFFVLFTTCKPLDVKRGTLFVGCVALFFLAIYILRYVWPGNILNLVPIPDDTMLLFLVFVAMLYPMVKILSLMISLLINFMGILQKKLKLSKQLRNLAKPLLSKKEVQNG